MGWSSFPGACYEADRELQPHVPVEAIEDRDGGLARNRIRSRRTQPFTQETKGRQQRIGAVFSSQRRHRLRARTRVALSQGIHGRVAQNHVAAVLEDVKLHWGCRLSRAVISLRGNHSDPIVLKGCTLE